VTTLGLFRGACKAGGVFCWILALGVLVASTAVATDHSSKNHGAPLVVIPLAALAAACLVFTGVRIFRTRVTVTPTSLTAYGLRGRRSVFSATPQEIADIEIRELATGIRGSSLSPYVVLRDGRAFPLPALSIGASSRHREEVVAAVDRIRCGMGMPIESPSAPSPIAEPTFPPLLHPPSGCIPEEVGASHGAGESNETEDGSEPGWRHDPWTAGGYRYFDGVRWTEWVHNGSYQSVSHLPHP